jgi:lysophospholipase L1-like esterase
MSDMPQASNPVAFKHPLPNSMKSLGLPGSTKIVAIGSSSTAGEGNIEPFPSRLELALRKRYPNRMIDVLNRGVSGEEATNEVLRFKPDVLDENPALVIWQVGTNAVYRDKEFKLDDVVQSIATGLDRLAGLPMDVILMDLQYTTAVVNPGKIELAERMVSLIAAAASDHAHSGVNLFRRFALTRSWCDGGVPIAGLIDPDDASQLHMSDWATEGVTLALDGAIGTAPSPTA